jgi:hypothetical protein
MAANVVEDGGRVKIGRPPKKSGSVASSVFHYRNAWILAEP